MEIWGLARTGTVALACLALAPAAEIQGTVVIKHRLTKKRITPAADSYDRGIAVKLDDGPVVDSLVYERTHVVVWVDEALPSKPGAFTLEQKNRRFAPDLLVIPAGSTVSFPNLDPVFHNVFSLSKAKSFDLGNYPKGQTRLLSFPNAGIIQVNCHLHSNMSATIVVTPNGHAVLAGPDGRFALKGLAPGKHTVVVWHKSVSPGG